ncbi:MAG: FAD-binding oxidoreductase [Solirubrobacterales bacterium]
MTARRLKHWGWGYADQQPDRAAVEAMVPLVRERLGFEVDRVEEPVPFEALEVAPPRLRVPDGYGDLITADPYERVSRAMGKAYRDVVRGFRGQFDRTPDLVALPPDEDGVHRALELAADRRLAVIPFGGGTSVVGGVEPRVGHGYRGVMTIDLRGLDRVLEIDEVSGSALIQGGATGPGLEAQLGGRGLTLRHFPQSFEYSTLGGWIATRAGGHFATGPTHIDDLVSSVRAITPRGVWESRRLPSSGAGPSPDRMLLGSEGILGLITEAWVRVRPRPTEKRSCAVRFDRFSAGVAAARELAQSGLEPANCRLLDPLEAETTGAGDGSHAILIVGFESAGVPVAERMELALELTRDHGGEPGEVRGGEGGGKPAGDDDAAGSWRSAFLQAPYLRDSLIALGVLTETFESAITWDRFDAFHAQVTEAARRTVAEVTDAPPDGPGAPRISCRFTHLYPEGPAPYFTVIAPARRGSEVEQWDEIKAAVSEAIIAAGGTITHHHAVGRDHRPWYDLQRPEPFAEALGAAKRAVDPEGLLNPGVLVDP